MFFDQFNPLEGKVLSILDENGKIINKALEPNLDKSTLLKMYETMLLGRIADIKALQFQRQGRMLTYALNKGQEGCQVGAASAMMPQDWLSPAFREVGMALYRGITLEQIFLYWYGNERGSNYDPALRVLPVNIIIGSQINLGAGLAMASKIKKDDAVVLATIGDGGTSHGEFYEGLNYAGAFNAPLVVMIQNNQYGISTPRSSITAAKTLAQKAYAMGIPGFQVDGNDVLAVHVALKEAFNHARAGKGPVLVEALTYRMAAHTTNDDPSIYRTKVEEDSWINKDPLIRFKQYLINKKYLTQAQDQALEARLSEHVMESFKQVESYGANVELKEIFEHTFEEMTPPLIEQYNEYQAFLKEMEVTENGSN